jgi:hypothetical protein
VADTGIYVAIGTFCLALLAYAVKLTWQVSRIEQEQREYTDAQVDNLKRDMTNLERDSVGRGDNIRQETGEMGAALRQKVHEMETWNRDTFVRKDSFELVVGRIEKSIEKMTDKLEDKIDKMAERFQRPS